MNDTLQKKILELCDQTEELVEVMAGVLGAPRSETDPINELIEEIRVEIERA